MAKLNKKKEIETPVEKEVVNGFVMNEAERVAIESEEQKVKDEGANTKRLELATDVVSKQFNLDNDYRVTKFDDKGKVVNMTLEGDNFILNVTIKDSERHGMYVE